MFARKSNESPKRDEEKLKKTRKDTRTGHEKSLNLDTEKSQKIFIKIGKKAQIPIDRKCRRAILKIRSREYEKKRSPA